jgi:hypothetical protein
VTWVISSKPATPAIVENVHMGHTFAARGLHFAAMFAGYGYSMFASTFAANLRRWSEAAGIFAVKGSFPGQFLSVVVVRRWWGDLPVACIQWR